MGRREGGDGSSGQLALVPLRVTCKKNIMLFFWHSPSIFSNNSCTSRCMFFPNHSCASFAAILIFSFCSSLSLPPSPSRDFRSEKREENHESIVSVLSVRDSSV